MREVNRSDARVVVVSNRLPHTLRRAGGDDRTDEDLFARLPHTAWTIHVGENQSRARLRLPGPEHMCLLLSEFVATGQAKAAGQTV